MKPNSKLTRKWQRGSEIMQGPTFLKAKFSPVSHKPTKTAKSPNSWEKPPKNHNSRNHHRVPAQFQKSSKWLPFIAKNHETPPKPVQQNHQTTLNPTAKTPQRFPPTNAFGAASSSAPGADVEMSSAVGPHRDLMKFRAFAVGGGLWVQKVSQKKAGLVEVQKGKMKTTLGFSSGFLIDLWPIIVCLVVLSFVCG